MDVSDEERRNAERAAKVVREKLLAIMDLQADIDGLLRDKHPTPFGSEKWRNASLESLQRLVAMTAIQFILFEPVDWVPGNDVFSDKADQLLETLANQLKTLQAKKAGP